MYIATVIAMVLAIAVEIDMTLAVVFTMFLFFNYKNSNTFIYSDN